MEKDVNASPRCTPAIKGYTWGYVDRWEGRFYAYSPGVLHQHKSQANVELRECQSHYVVVGFGEIGR